MPFTQQNLKHKTVKMSNGQLHSIRPTITFIMPIQKREELLIEQINAIFKFSTHYPGFCEIIIIENGAQDATIKLASLAIKLNKINNPHVRTKIIRYTSQLPVNNMIETGIRHALGQKIILITNNPEKIDQSQICNLDMLPEEILTTGYFVNTTMIDDFLHK